MTDSVPAKSQECTMVNPYCPNDLCVMEYDHPGSDLGRHITDTRYGSANSNYAEQLEILRDPALSGWGSEVYVAPQGTSDEDLIRLGWEAQERYTDERYAEERSAVAGTETDSGFEHRLNRPDPQPWA